jgi:hypothetical protein
MVARLRRAKSPVTILLDNDSGAACRYVTSFALNDSGLELFYFIGYVNGIIIIIIVVL